MGNHKGAIVSCDHSQNFLSVIYFYFILEAIHSFSTLALFLNLHLHYPIAPTDECRKFHMGNKENKEIVFHWK